MTRVRIKPLIVAAALAATSVTATAAAAPAAPSAPAPCYLTHPIGFGNNDPTVVCLKKRLRALRLLARPDNGRYYTTHYGWQTRAAVKRAQKRFGLRVTGNIDFRTALALDLIRPDTPND